MVVVAAVDIEAQDNSNVLVVGAAVEVAEAEVDSYCSTSFRLF